MANTDVRFSIQFDGTDSIDKLTKAINETKVAMKDLDRSTEEYAENSKLLGKIEAELKGVKKQQDDVNKSFLEASNALGAYDKASSKLNRLRKEYKNLAFENKGATKEAKALLEEIQALDAQLKETDGQVGQFQRNVGNYPESFFNAKTALVKFIPGLEDLNNKFKESGASSSGFQVALIGAFAAFAAGQKIIQIIGDLNEFNKTLGKTEQQLKALTGITGDELDSLSVDIQSLAKTFDVDSKSIIDSAKQISEKTGVSFQDAIGQIENGLLKGNESADTFLSNIAEMPEAYAKVSEASGEYANKQKDLLESNKELIDGQIEGAKKFEQVGRTMEVLGNNIKAYLIDYLLFAYEKVFLPFYNNALLPLGNALDKLIKQFGGAGISLEFLGKMVYLGYKPLEILINLYAKVIDGLAGIIQYAKEAGQYLGLVSKQSKEQSDAAVNNIKMQQDAEQKALAEKQKIEAEKAKAEQDAINKEKERIEANKKAVEEYKRQQEQLQKDRKKFIDDENKYIESALKINQSIIDKTNKLTTELITDEYRKRRVIAQENYDAEIKGIQDSLNEQKKANIERIKEAEKLFGLNSVQAKKAKEEAKANEIAGAEELANLQISLKIKLTDELLAIDKDQNNKLIEENKKLYDQRKNQIQNSYTNELNILDTFLAEGLIKEDEYNQKVYELNKKRIEDLLALNKNQLANNKDLNSQEIESIVSSNIALNKDLAKLESQRTQKFKEESDKRTNKDKEEAQKRKEKLNQDIQDAGKYAQLALDTLQGFIEISEQKRLDRIEKDEEANQRALENLNERLQRATGLERRFLEQRIASEEETAKKLAKEKEKLEKDAAKRKKASAIIESVINTALAVSSALATPPAPNVVAALIAGIAGAAQTAVIAAQPLAKGGVVGKGDEIVQFASGGRVTSKGNIKPLSNGDNVLATLKTGEIVLNESQQRRIGYASLKKAQIPNFANGGLVGAPSTLITNANNSIANEQMRVNLMDEMISATNNRIDRLSVVYTATTDYEVEKGRNDKKTIKANSTF